MGHYVPVRSDELFWCKVWQALTPHGSVTPFQIVMLSLIWREGEQIFH